LKNNKLKPVIKKIVMNFTTNNLVITVPLIKTPTGNLWVFDRRGGWGHEGVTKDLNKYKSKPGYEYNRIKSSSLTEHFITCEL
jgi:hypothetical protein